MNVAFLHCRILLKGASTRSSKRGRKKSKVSVGKSKVENEPSTNVSTDAMQTTNDEPEKSETKVCLLSRLTDVFEIVFLSE